MISYISTLLDFAATLFICANFINMKIRPNRRYLSIFVLPTVLFLSHFLPSLLQMEFVSTCIMLCVYMLIITFIFQCRLYDAVCSVLFGFIPIIGIQLTFVFLNHWLFSITDQNVIAIVGNMYTILVICLLYLFVPLSSVYRFIFSSSTIVSFGFLNLFIICFLLSLLYKLNLKRFEEYTIFFLFAYSILMGINLILFYQLKELNMQKKKLEAYDEYMPMVQQLITQVRIRQHNHTNEIQSLIALTHIHKDYDSLTHAMYHYIGDMVNNSPPEYLLKSNMLLVSGFLYQKERMAEKEHKTIHYHFKTYELHSYAPEYILTELFGILIDNALEAIDKEQIVSVQIDSINERVIFSISNPGYLLSGKERTLFFEKGYSSKTNSDSGTHSGLGLYRLKNVVMEQYKGSISLYNEGTNIIFDITI